VNQSSPPSLEFILVPHTHWDREWYLPFEDFRCRLVRLLDRLVAIMEADPEFKFFHLDGQTIVLEDYEAIRGPHPGLRRLIQAGRIHIGPWYVLPDEFLVTGESIIRNLQEGFRVARQYGVEPVAIGYLPDMFGHIAQIPQILAGFGLDTAVVWRGITPDVTQNQFIWRALDGSQVFAAYLPLGYGFAFELPDDPRRLIERLQLFLLALKQNETTGVLLLTNGTDHWEAQAHIPATLRALAELKPDWRLEMGNFPLYLQRVRERIQKPPVHQGELRACDRTLILPSVASTRLYLKQMDFRATSLLERYLEPLSALARAFGSPDHRDHLRYAWRLLLQNHPHDSICGCSVDAVHDEMETRYAKVNQISERLLGEALAALAGQAPGPGPRLLAWNPNAAPGAGPLAGEVQMRLPANPGLVTASGETVPLQVKKLAPEKVEFEITAPKIGAAIAIDMLAVEEQIGDYIQGWRIKRKGNTLHVTMDLASRRTALDLARFRREMEAALAPAEVTLLHVQLAHLPRYEIAASVPARPGLSVSSYQVRRGQKTAASSRLQASPELLENENWQVRLDQAGRISVTHSASGLAIAGLRFLDLGDRGDEYNFDPVAGDRAITDPVAVKSRLVAPGPVMAELEVRHRFRVPAELSADRKARSRRTVPLDLVTRIRLGQDSREIGFRTEFLNRGRDHRLQVAFEAPLVTDQYLVETALGEVVRPIQPTSPPPPAGPLNIAAALLGAEGTYSTSPQKTYAAVSDGKRGLALFNRGLAEVEAVRLDGRTRLALTLVRGVGWLSRSDLSQRTQHAGPPLATPGGQSLRQCSCEYALFAFSGPAESAGIAAAAHAFAFPSLLFPARGHLTGCPAPGELSAVAIDNPAVELSALVSVEAEAADLRLYNTTNSSQPCRVSLGPAFRLEGAVDLQGRKAAAPEAKLSAQSAELFFRPFQIITLRLALGK